MSFTYDLSTTLGVVRLLIPDTDAASYNFEDAELQALISLELNDPRMAAAQALDILAQRASQQAIRYTINGFSMDRTQVAKTLSDRAHQLRHVAESEPYELESVLEHYVDSAGRDFSNYPTTPPDASGP